MITETTLPFCSASQNPPCSQRVRPSGSCSPVRNSGFQKVRVLEHFGDACSIFSARFRYIEFHFRPASQSIKIFATRLDVVRASSRAALSRAAFTSLGILAVRTTAGGGESFCSWRHCNSVCNRIRLLATPSTIRLKSQVPGRLSPFAAMGGRRRRASALRAGAVPNPNNQPTETT